MVTITWVVIRTQRLDQIGTKSKSKFEIKTQGRDKEEAKAVAKRRCQELFPFCNITLRVKEEISFNG